MVQTGAEGAPLLSAASTVGKPGADAATAARALAAASATPTIPTNSVTLTSAARGTTAIPSIELRQAVPRRPRLADVPRCQGILHMRLVALSVRLRVHGLLQQLPSAAITLLTTACTAIVASFPAAAFKTARIPIGLMPLAQQNRRIRLEALLAVSEWRALRYLDRGLLVLQLPRRPCPLPLSSDHVQHDVCR